MWIGRFKIPGSRACAIGRGSQIGRDEWAGRGVSRNCFRFFFFRYCGNSVPCCNFPLTAPIRGGRAGVARRLFQLEPSPSRPVTIGAIKTRILNVTQASLNANITSAVSPFLCTVVAHRLLVHEWWRFRIRTGGGVSIMTFWGSFVLRTSIFSGTKLYECNFLAPR